MYALFFLPLVPTLGLFFAGRPFEAGVFLSTAEVFLCCGEDLQPLLFILFLWCLGIVAWNAGLVVRVQSCREEASELGQADHPHNASRGGARRAKVPVEEASQRTESRLLLS